MATTQFNQSDDPFARARDLLRRGQLRSAESVCRQALRRTPDQPSGLMMLGVIAQQRGAPQRSLTYLRRAASKAPTNAEIQFNLGVAHQHLSEWHEAAECYRRTLALQPRHPGALNNLAMAYWATGEIDAAIQTFEQLLALKGEDPATLTNLGMALRSAGRAEAAVACHQRAIAAQPSLAQAHNNLGNALLDLHHPQQAMDAFRAALAHRPDYADAWSNLGTAQAACGHHQDAVAAQCAALERARDNDRFWQRFAATLEPCTYDTASPEIEQWIVQLLDRRYCDPVRLTRPILSLLETHAAFRELLSLTDPSHDPARVSFNELAARLGRIALFDRFAWLTPICSPQVEDALARFRQMLVSQARAEEQLSAPALACAAAVAAQSFLSEYLDVVEAPDNGHVQAAAAQCTADLAAGRQPTPEIVAAVAAYQPLHQLENGERLNRFDWPEPIARLIELQLNEPAREANLRASLPTLTPITDETSCAVQAQYESHPYPRWRKLDVPTVPLSLDRYLRENVGTGPVHALPAQTGARVLVAGCGTGRHAIRTAFRFTGCEVLAIDLSRSSLGYARRQSEALGLANVSYAQADLLELEQMDETFDVIESVGVLHHLADPTAGLGQLVKRLRPGGLLKLGLYSRAGRADINWARAWTEQNAIQGDARGIQRLRAWVRERAEAGDPHARSLLRRSDFFATSLVRDMLLHVCEHQFDFMQIQRMLAECDLAFLGLEPANMASYRRFRTRYPEPDKLTDLAAWAAFEREHPEMFRGMYQFWCQKPG